MARDLADARRKLEEAKAHYERTVLRALKAGGSYGEIAHHMGIAKSQVGSLANRLGWPPADVKLARERERADQRKWRDEIRRQVDERWRPDA